MSKSIQFQEYPIFVLANPEYWEKKSKFRFPFGRLPIWTLIANIDGRFSFTVNQVSGESTLGDILLVPPNMDFYREIIDPLSFFYIRFIHRAADSPEERKTIEILADLYGYKYTTPEQDRLFNNYRHLLSLYEKHDDNSRKWITHFVSDIWLLFCQEAETLVQTKNTLDPLMKKAKDRIDQKAFSDIKIRDIAKFFDLHPVQFTRRFQKSFGMSPSHYLSSVRIENAKLLLTQTDYTIDHIAQLCGYNNGFYFSRIFTQYTKMNPSIFRNAHA